MTSLNPQALDQLFFQARTYHGFRNEALPADTVAQLYDLLKWAPTAFNASPARFVFVQSPENKKLLCEALMQGNIAQTQQAPLTVIVASDLQFYDYLPQLFPAFDARSVFANNPALAERAGLQNSSLQAAYLIMAARSLGLDCGPMTGFDRTALDQRFFPEGQWSSQMLVNIGYGNPDSLYPRGLRLDFATACRVC